jgi:hypothetical protein
MLSPLRLAAGARNTGHRRTPINKATEEHETTQATEEHGTTQATEEHGTTQKR